MANEMKLQKDTNIFNPGQTINTIGIIESGAVVMKSNYFSLTLEKGQVMGLFHLYNRTATTNDVAGDDTVLSAYRLENSFPNTTVLQEDTTLQRAALETIKCQMNACIKLYSQYKEKLKNISLIQVALVKKYCSLCEKLQITPRIAVAPMEPAISEILNTTPFSFSYYEDLEKILDKHSENFLQEHKKFLFGIILKSSEDFTIFKDLIEKLVSAIITYRDQFFNEEYNDYFRYFSELLSRTHAGTDDFNEAKALITTLYTCLYQMPFVDKDSLQMRMDEQKKKIQVLSTCTNDSSQEENSTASIQTIIVDSMNKILAAAEESDEFVSSFTKHIAAYKELVDKTSNSPAATTLRKGLVEDFHRLYANLALKYVRGEQLSDTVKLFLNFGYIDEDLAGEENAIALCKLLHADISDSSEHIYTFIDWLKAIYLGKKEPSRNEFDMDYTDFLRTERVSGKITAQEEKQKLENAEEKVLYELENFFPQANKMTYGHISYYCPFFSKHNLIDRLEKGLLGVTKLLQERDFARNVDYQLFYKEVVYTNPAIGINAEFIHTEIMPDIILMPNYGARGIMWQEVEGKKRATPCRMVLPIFTPENLRGLFLRLCGEYRWEMCKRTQGSHWNDPSSNSLTGDYFDYLQFYRKNNDLSADAKEKVKTQMTKARNSIKEAFVIDYMIWVAYESDGSPRLNKVARTILFTHCPFPKEARQKLTQNPIYLSVIQRHATKYEQLSHRMNNLCQKLTNNGKKVPKEFLEEISFFDK